MLLKEFLQLRRDRVTLATMITIPLMQLLLFGYAINTMPRDLPTAVLLQENSDVGRVILKALENSRFFKVTRQVRDEAEFDEVLQSGAVLFGVEIPAEFERALRRGDRPALLVAADAHRSRRLRHRARRARADRADRARQRARHSRHAPTRRSKSASTPATIRPRSTRSTSCPACSAPSSP